MHKRGVAALFLLGLLTPIRTLEGQNVPGDSATIHDLGRKFSAAFVGGDAAGMAAMYTPDAVIFPERSEMIRGVEAIRRYWSARPGRRVTRHELTPARIVVDGRHAYDYGTYVIAGEQDSKPWGPFAGKYVVVWRRDPGASWRMVLDIWNSGANP
jgi:ketosteroid isomerase-like protein